MNAKVQIQFPEQLIPFYSVADIISAYSIASEAATQLRTLANQINKATAFVKTFVQENDRADSSAFAELENLIIISYQPRQTLTYVNLTDIRISLMISTVLVICTMHIH